MTVFAFARNRAVDVFLNDHLSPVAKNDVLMILVGINDECLDIVKMDLEDTLTKNYIGPSMRPALEALHSMVLEVLISRSQPAVKS
jgi:hypothetical protein